MVPALILGVGIMFMPQSPRWLMTKGREEECLQTLAKLRRKPTSDEGIRLEYLEVKAYVYSHLPKAVVGADHRVQTTHV